MRPFLIILGLVATLAGCSVPGGFPGAASSPEEPIPPSEAGMVEPVMEAQVTETGTAPDEGLAEPVMEPAIVEERSATSLSGTTRPRHRPARSDQCRPGDDGIGGTGCPID
jgi:hypothetical protein